MIFCMIEMPLIQLQEYPIPRLSVPARNRHKNRRMAISREPRVVSGGVKTTGKILISFYLKNKYNKKYIQNLIKNIYIS